MTSAGCSKPHTDLTLALAGAEDRLQLVLGADGPNGPTLLASREWTVPGQSVRFLVPGLHETLAGLGANMDAVSRIACVNGPGSFTGLRIVLAAAEGLAAGRNLPRAGIDYLPLLASGPASIAQGILHVLTYARRGLVYFQSFNLPSLYEAHPLVSCTLEQAAAQMTAMGDEAMLLGTGLRKNSDFFAEFVNGSPGYRLLPPMWDHPSPQGLLSAAYRANFAQSPIAPVYLRPSDAEDNLPQIARQRGLDPEVARERLERLRQE